MTGQYVRAAASELQESLGDDEIEEITEEDLGPAPQENMAPPPPVTCSALGCAYATPEGAPNFETIVKLLTLHISTAHPQEAGGQAAARPTSKVD